MARCQTIRRKKRKFCIGDLDKWITLQNRNLTAPNFATADFDEDFVNTLEVAAGVTTVTGKTFFDGVGTETPITHEWMIYFDESVNASTWILFEDRRMDILAVQDFEERHEWMLLTCVDRGAVSKQASKA